MLAAQQIWKRGRVNKSQSHGITFQHLLSGLGGLENHLKLRPPNSSLTAGQTLSETSAGESKSVPQLAS